MKLKARLFVDELENKKYFQTVAVKGKEVIPFIYLGDIIYLGTGSDDPKHELWKKHIRVYNGIRNAFKQAGVYSVTIDGIDTKLSSYSLRGTYITNRVQHGVPKEHIALACGTSTTMIDRHYSVAKTTDFLESFINLDHNYDNPPKITPKIRNAYKRWLNERKSEN